MMTDPISDMLTRIRNASMVHKGSIELPSSKMKEGVAQVLVRQGYLTDAKTVEQGVKKILKLTLKYSADRVPAVTAIRRISKPGRRLYAKADELKTVRSGFGITILSTPKGIMTNIDAKKQRLGGELICEIY
jgi:small subunit ribosomal protein S8